jgi:hypothetical protein
MEPSHPCITCGHATPEECLGIASQFPGRARQRCHRCGDDCVVPASEPLHPASQREPGPVPETITPPHREEPSGSPPPPGRTLPPLDE